MTTYKFYNEETRLHEDFTMRELLVVAATTQKKLSGRRDLIDQRRDSLIMEIEILFNNAQAHLNFAETYEEKPCAGAAYSVIELSDRFRINYRCGYGRNNYAPCVEVMKEKN